MRFNIFFIEYQIMLKELKATIDWHDLPLYRKIAIISFFISGTLALIFLVLQKTLIVTIFSIILIIIFIAFACIDSTKKNLKTMLNQHYIPYSQDRCNKLIELLKKYNIDYTNSTKLDLLISQTEEALVKNNPLTPIKNPLKLLGTIIVPIIVAIAQKINESSTTEELINIAAPLIVIVICIFSIIYAIFPAIRYLLYKEYSTYCELIYDLKQTKIFYSKEN